MAMYLLHVASLVPAWYRREWHLDRAQHYVELVRLGLP